MRVQIEKISFLIIALGLCIQVNAQVGGNPDGPVTPIQIMTEIYKAYDSINYLTFDVKYTYSSDTLNGNFINDALEGSYTMAGKRALYNLGNIQFMQNDSFL